MRRIASLFIVLLFIVVACQKTKIENPDRTLVQIGKLSLDKQVFLNRYRLSKDFAEAKTITKDDVIKFADEYFVKNYLLVNKLLDDGIEQDKDVKSDLERLKKRAMTGMNGPLYRKVIPAKVEVSEKEIKDLYDRTNYVVKIAYLRVSSKHLADSLYNLLKNGADFAEIARKFSLDIHTYEHGGEVRNYIQPGTLDPEFEKVIFSLKEGEVSKPIYITGWYNIVKIIKRKPVKKKPLAEMKNELKQRIQQFKLNQIRNNYIDSLFIKYDVKIHKELFPYIKKAFVPFDRIGQLKIDRIPKDKQKAPLVTFKGGEFTLLDFVKAYNSSNAASRVPLRYDDEIENHIKTLVIGDLMYTDAVARGLLDDEQFKFLYNRMRIQKLEREALKRLVNDQIKITDEEARDYYEQHKEDWNNQPFEKVERFIKNRLKAQRAKEFKDRLAEELRKKYGVVYNETVLKQVVDSLNTMKKSAKIRKF